MQFRLVALMSGLMLATSVCPPILAAEYSRIATVVRIYPIAHVRPSMPTTQDVLRVYVNPASWGASNCRTDAVDIKGDDWLLIATFMSAWKDGRSIMFHVDDTLHAVSGDTVCQVTTMGIE